MEAVGEDFFSLQSVNILKRDMAQVSINAWDVHFLIVI